LIIFASLACGFANRSLDGLGEDVPDTGCVFAQDVGVDAQGYGGVGVAEAGGYDVDGDSGEKQRGRVQVAQIVQPGMGEWRGQGVTHLLCALISLIMSDVTVSG
jgi:hypothetical protein